MEWSRRSPLETQVQIMSHVHVYSMGVGFAMAYAKYTEHAQNHQISISLHDQIP